MTISHLKSLILLPIYDYFTTIPYLREHVLTSNTNLISILPLICHQFISLILLLCILLFCHLIIILLPNLQLFTHLSVMLLSRHTGTDHYYWPLSALYFHCHSHLYNVNMLNTSDLWGSIPHWLWDTVSQHGKIPHSETSARWVRHITRDLYSMENHSNVMVQ